MYEASRIRSHAARQVLATLLLAVIWPAPTTAEDAVRARPFHVRPLGSFGIYAPGKWGTVAIDVANPTGDAVELLTSVYFTGDSSRQAGRQLWVPPHAKRSSWFPLRLPSNTTRDQQHLELHSLLFDRSLGQDVPLRTPQGAQAQSGIVAVEHQRPVTGIIADAEDVHVREVVLAMRRAQNRSERVVFLDVERLPPLTQALDAFDQLVLSSDALGRSAALSAVRSWLYAGGRLWVMLDQVDSANVALLLGEDFDLHVVDRVALTEVKIEAAIGQSQYPDGRHRQLASPADLVRVLPMSGDVAYQVGDWPVAIWQRVGRGQVLLTALEDRAWIDDMQVGNRDPSEQELPSPPVATKPLTILANEFLQTRPAAVMPTRVLREFVKEQIGYRIVDGGIVAGLLGGFCLAMIAGGILLTRLGCLEHLAWLGAVSAVAVASVLMAVGNASRRQVPPTVAVAEFVHAFPEAEQAMVTGLAALYLREPLSEPWQGRDEAVPQFEKTVDSANINRLVWTDLNTCHWENLALSPGIHFATFSSTPRLGKSMAARATFTPDGITGRLDVAHFKNLADAIIATPTGKNLAVHIKTDGQFSATTDDLLPTDRFVTSLALSDLQLQRAEVYRELLAPDRSSIFPASPTLLVWAETTQIPLDLFANVPAQGTALLALPLTIERPLPGSRITIPAALLPFESVAGISGTPPSAAYDNSKRQWIGPLQRGSSITLRFQLPTEVLPITLSEAEIEIEIHAPRRDLQIATVSGGRELAVKKFASPAGRVRCRIDNGQLLQLDERGGLLLTLTVGSHPDEELAGVAEVGWRIEDVRLDASGVTLEL